MRANIFQDNYAKWRFNVVDDLGNALDTGNQHLTPELAEAELELWLELHPEVAASGLSVFRDGSTTLRPPAIKMPKIDRAAEERAAGIARQATVMPPMPAGWNELSPREEHSTQLSPETPPDAGISERGVEELNPIAAQRLAVDSAMQGAQIADTWNWPRAFVVPGREDPAGVHDGDTFYANVDQGRGTWWIRGSIRLAGINAPELKDKGGQEAKQYLQGLLPLGTQVSLESVGYDKWKDRCDAIVRLADGRIVNDLMVESGHAVRRDYGVVGDAD